jgi:GST-like protein
LENLIDVYTWPTPNGHKIHIMLEECGLPYAVHAVDIGAGEQFEPDFLAISPNNRIPAIVDPDGPDGKPISLFESGAILLYLAGKTGRFLPASVRGKYETTQWLMWQMGNFGPMLGQAHHFRLYAPEKVDYAINRYSREATRLYRVLEQQLEGKDFVTGSEYTIADMAILPWARSRKNQGIETGEFPNVERWIERLQARPAVQRALQVLADRRKPLISQEAFSNLFGDNQYRKR